MWRYDHSVYCYEYIYAPKSICRLTFVKTEEVDINSHVTRQFPLKFGPSLAKFQKMYLEYLLSDQLVSLTYAIRTKMIYIMKFKFCQIWTRYVHWTGIYDVGSQSEMRFSILQNHFAILHLNAGCLIWALRSAGFDRILKEFLKFFIGDKRWWEAVFFFLKAQAFTDTRQAGAVQTWLHFWYIR